MRDHDVLEPPDAAIAPELLTPELDPFATAMSGGDTLPTAGLPVWLEVERQLVARGWSVKARLLWVVEAHRDHDSEQALGVTRNEAYAQLGEIVRLDEGPRVP